MLANLVANAVKFTDAGSVVFVAETVAHGNGDRPCAFSVDRYGAPASRPPPSASISSRSRALDSGRR